MNRIKKHINTVNWINAKTYSKTAPHEYIVRKNNPELEKEFIYFVEFIRENGYKKKYGRSTYTYLDIDGYKYWTMGAPIKITIIINREKL